MGRLELLQSRCQSAFKDFVKSIMAWRIWVVLANQDIKLRYRRSKLGPFWITLSMAITIYSMGFLYGHLFKMDLQSYYPYLATGMIGWGLISGIVNDMTEVYSASSGFIKQISLPYTLYIHRTLLRNFIIFFHNIVVYIPIILIFHQVAKINWDLLILIPGLALIYINGFFFGLLTAVFCSRYPDLKQIVKSLIQVIFFLTPVMWNISSLPEKGQFLAALNPFFCLLDLIRAPLMGYSIKPAEMMTILAITLTGIILSGLVFAKYRPRIIYWI